MTAALIIVFVLAYFAIALEQPLKIDKSATALTGAGLLWTIYALSSGGHAGQQLEQSLVATAEVAFFLIGAMTVVSVVDAHDGFAAIGSHMRARSLAHLTVLVSAASFILSAVLDNLTTAIVMVSLVGRLLRERDDRWLVCGMVVIAANAGGAWSPIGDVTTTMLWIGGRVTSAAIIAKLFLPSLVNMLVPLAAIAWGVRGRPVIAPELSADGPLSSGDTTRFERNLMLVLGLAVLLAVPAFKAMTGLPPFLGILFGLGIVWTVGDIVHRGKEPAGRRVTIADALTRIDMITIVFLIGILLAVATLEHAGVLAALADWLNAEVGRLDLIVLAFGLLSAVIDNVPMVAAAMGMYDVGTHPPDSFLWEFMAYCAGTGGSILIIGSAAGVAVMGAEKIEFMWYLRRFGGLALAGYFAGALIYLMQLM
jgi:Na+/H+ antiporter NhaD/arsenite permease-like protein